MATVPVIPPGWELADQRILQHIAVLEDAGIAVPNWLHDDGVPAALAHLMRGEWHNQNVLVDLPDVWKRESVSRLSGPAVDELDLIRTNSLEPFKDMVWGTPGRPAELLTASLEFMNLCPTAHYVAAWALDAAEARA